MSGDKFTVLFWTSHRICPFTGSALARMVFTEVKKTTLVFDLGLFIATTKAQLQKAISPQEVDSYMTPFVSYLYYGDVHSFGVKNCEFISKLMYEQIVGGKVNLNENTPFSYDGNEKANEVLEDCLRVMIDCCVWRECRNRRMLMVAQDHQSCGREWKETPWERRR